MVRAGRLARLAAVLTLLARAPLPSSIAFTGGRTPAAPLSPCRNEKASPARFAASGTSSSAVKAPAMKPPPRNFGGVGRVGQPPRPRQPPPPERIGARRTGRRAASECVVFVDNLDWDVTVSELEDHMGQTGEVVEVAFLERIGGRPSRARIVYKKPQEARAALRELRNTQLGGLAIRVLQTQPATPDCYVVVQNLDYDVSNAELNEHMRKAGRVLHIRRVKKKGQPNIAFIEYNKPQDAEAAVQRIHDTQLGDRPIRVLEMAEPGAKVFAGNLPYPEGQDLQELFSDYGKVLRVHLRPDGESATVQFKKAKDAQAAVDALNDSDFQGQSMQVYLTNR